MFKQSMLRPAERPFTRADCLSLGETVQRAQSWERGPHPFGRILQRNLKLGLKSQLVLVIILAVLPRQWVLTVDDTLHPLMAFDGVLRAFGEVLRVCQPFWLCFNAANLALLLLLFGVSHRWQRPVYPIAHRLAVLNSAGLTFTLGGFVLVIGLFMLIVLLNFSLWLLLIYWLRKIVKTCRHIIRHE